MNPALSVIFFTTLSGAGYGLLAWTGLWPLLLGLAGDAPSVEARKLLLWCAGLGLLLVTAGFLSSLAHLGKPGRTWRALSQWRSSWMSREGVLALLAYLPAFALVALLWLHGGHRLPAWAMPVVGALVVVCSLATVWATGMIYASLRTIPAWSMRAVPAIYLLFALGTGMSLLFLLAVARLGLEANAGMAWALVAQGALLAIAKGSYWRRIDAQGLPQTRGDAVGLPGRQVGVFERPHTEANFVTREMAFEIARRNASSLRGAALALLLGGPLLAALLQFVLPGAALAASAVAAVAMLAGAFVERWLFFAQARHVVTLYY